MSDQSDQGDGARSGEPTTPAPASTAAPSSAAQKAAELAVGALSPAEQQALAATVIQGLDTPQQQQAAAEGVVGALPAEAKQDLAATVIQGLDTPQQQQAAAEGVVGALPAEAKQDLAATVVQSLDTPQQQRAAAEGVVGALPAEQRQQLAEGVLGLGPPDPKTQQNLWYIVIWTMAAAIFVFGSMAFVLIYQKKAAEAPLALATTALGGVVGLIATSPGGRRSG